MKLRRRAQPGGPVTVVLPPHLVLTKLIRVPRIEPAKRARIIAFEAEQGIPYALNDVVWDSVVAAEHDSDLEVLLTAAKLEAVESLCATVQAAGFKPRLILPSPLATLAAFRLVHDASSEPALILNLGARSTTLLQMVGARFVTRTMALGGQSRLVTDAAETLATRLAQEVTRSMLFFRRQCGMPGATRVYLTGGGAGLAGLSETLAAKLEMPVDRLDVLSAIEIGPDAVRLDAAGPTLALTDLAGAAAIRLRPGLPMVNLLPPQLRRRESRRRRLPWLAATVILAGAALLPPLFHFRAHAAAARHKTSAVERALAPLPDETPPKSLTVTPPLNPTDDSTSVGLELIEVKLEPYRLQLAGYFGEPGDYVAVFVSSAQPETLLARRGRRLGQLGLTLQSIEVRKVEVANTDGLPVYDVAALAVLLDEKTGEEVVLDNRLRKLSDTPLAVLRLSAAGATPRTLHEGDSLADEAATYRVERIQLDPREVVVARQTPGLLPPETRVIRLVGREEGVAAKPIEARESPTSARASLAASGN